MEITVQRTPLLEVCKIADRAVAAAPVDPVLGNLLVQARARDCLCTATDLRVGLRLRVPAQVARTGRALIPARQLLGILREAVEEELTIRSEPGRVLVRGGDSVFELRGDDPASFPALPACPDGPFGEIPAGALRRAIQRTLFAAGKAATRHSRRGVLWEIEPDQVRLVATDNRRLAVAEVPVIDPPMTPMTQRGERRTALVSTETMDLLERLACPAGAVVRVLFGERHAFFRSPGAALCTRLLEGRFPPWRQVLPGPPRYRLVLPVEEFLCGVKQAAVLRDRPEARVLLRFQGDRVTLWSRQAGTGRARVEQAIALPSAREPVEVAFNPIFLAELLKVLEDETTVRLELRDADSPALFHAGDDYRHVLMPLRRS
jgi:DNA polymerase-3 subunit beta